MGLATNYMKAREALNLTSYIKYSDARRSTNNMKNSSRTKFKQIMKIGKCQFGLNLPLF